MKKKIHKIFGIGLTLVMAVSLIAAFAAPVAAAEEEWTLLDYPVTGAAGDYFMDTDITSLGPIAKAINDDLYLGVDGVGGYLGETATATVTTAFVDGGDTFAETYSVTYVNESGVGGRAGSVVIPVSAGVGVTVAISLDGTDAGIWDITAMAITTGDATQGVIDITSDTSTVLLASFDAIPAATGTFTDGAALATDVLMKSTDAGRTWEETGFRSDITQAQPIVDIACSSDDADILYVATLSNVYKSDDAGAAASWSDLGDPRLADAPALVREGITSLAVGYADDDPHLFVGTNDTAGTYGEVFYYRDAPFAAVWTDLDVSNPDATGAIDTCDVFGVAVSPDFDNDTLVVAVVYDGALTASYVTANEGAGIGLNNWDDMEIQDDTATPVSFAITEATNPVFVEDFDIDDAYELFVGVSGEAHNVSKLGGVYRITGRTDDDDFLLDDVDDDIASLDAVGILGATSLLAGTAVAAGPASVWYSTDDGDSWSETDKAPTGTGATQNLVIVDDDFADSGMAWSASDAATDEGGVHLTTDFGATWNGISMMDTDMGAGLNDIAFSVDYGTGDAPAFMITRITGDATRSVWKHDGTNWERVYECLTATYDLDLVEVSPGYADDEAVFIADATTAEILYSHNGGATFTEMIRQPAAIESWVVIDDETVITGDDAGKYHKTTRYGRRIWDTDTISPGGNTITSLAISPDFANDHTVLAGDAKSLVYISTDDGEAWDEVSASDLAGLVGAVDNTYVAFDPGYADNNTFYAASDDTVGRCVIDPDVDWDDQVIDDMGATIADAGDMVVSTDGTEGGVPFGTLYVADRAAKAGIIRCLNPTDALADIVFETIDVGLVAGETFEWNLRLTYGSNVLYAIDTNAAVDIWTYEDTLAAPVILTSPADEARLKDTARVEFEWAALNADTVNQYQIWVNEEADFPAGTDEEVGTVTAPSDIHDGTTLVWRAATPGTEYYWKVRVALGQPVLSRWSVARTLFTKVAAVTEPIAVRPLPGAQDIILMPTFAWREVTGAASYDIEIAPTAAFTAGVIKGTSPINAWQIDTELEYSTTYYWRVRGISASGAPAGDWVVSVFTTMAEPVPAPPPVVVEPTPPPVVEVPARKMITPNWIYAIIGIGAALAIVVVVLIVRTRRVP